MAGFRSYFELDKKYKVVLVGNDDNDKVTIIDLDNIGIVADNSQGDRVFIPWTSIKFIFPA